MQKVINVGYSFPLDVVSTNSGGTANAVLWGTGTSTGNLAPAVTAKWSKSRVWYSGSYLNFLPTTKDQYDASHEAALKARYVLGVHLTPEVLWELAPWSWAVDWLTNTQEIISSVSNSLQDGMVLRDSYVMHHHQRYAGVFATGNFMSGDGKIDRFSPASTTVVSETKKRFVTVPYFGFNDPGDLSDRQLVILAALGISRA
jgi:hypothetical protein